MNDADRRQFFRINQQVAMELSLVTEDSLRHTGPAHFDVSPSFSLICELQDCEAESQLLLHKIAEKDRHIAEYLRLMSKKVNTLAKAVFTSDVDPQKLITHDVNLSEGGMLFYYPDALPSNAPVHIKLIFPSSSVGVQMQGTVLRCDPIETGDYEVAIEFVRLAESTRTLLARQIIESQALSRRQQIE